jgi:hypothetical protein
MVNEMTQNPKLKDSNIIDCIPQTEECPLKCDECFYNGGRFYRTIQEPLMPTVDEAQDKIVRVNSGNDSNVNQEFVIEQTKQYSNKFYNTSLPNFDFPEPVVFTCNGRNLILAEKGLENLMFVRVRATIFDVETIDKAVQHYLVKHKIPIVLTFMRYYDINKIPQEYRHFFEFKKHVLNSYYCHTLEAQLKVMSKYKGLGVRMCGTNVSSFCIDCGNCEFLYWKAKLKSQSSIMTKQINQNGD